MESSPLTLAHSHARNALAETRKSNPVAASEEHDLAAGEFATAAQQSVDPDALRTLHLLEDHHKRLAEILRFKHEHPVRTDLPSPPALPQVTQTTPSEPLPPQVLSTNTLPSSERLQQEQQLQNQNLNPNQQPPRLSTAGRARLRDPTSIAGSLATARGIPSRPPRGSPASPTLSAQNAGARMAGSPAGVKNTMDPAYLEPHGQVVPSNTTSALEGPLQEAAATAASTGGAAIAGLRTLANDESFQKFYSTFEGLISKISAPLAFASLPLGTDPMHQRRQSGPKAAAANTKLDRQPAAADRWSYPGKGPDVKKLVSSAALRAIKDRSGQVPSTNVAESFYVVPTAGGMISYAGILSRAEKEARRENTEDGEDDFVDAREDPPSPEVLRGDSKSGKMPEVSLGTKTMEELQMENRTLKHLTDTLSKRLHMWEVNAQSSSMALHQSLRAMKSHPIAAATSPLPQISPSASTAPEAQVQAPSSAADINVRVKELEESLRRQEKELHRVEHENEKLKSVIGRYRERWEKLKEGARVRREGNGNGNGNGRGNGGGAARSLAPAQEHERLTTEDADAETTG